MQLGQLGQGHGVGGGRRARDVVAQAFARGRVALVGEQPAGDRLAAQPGHHQARAVGGDPVDAGGGYAVGAGGSQGGEFARAPGRVLDPRRVAAQHQLKALGAKQDVKPPQLARGSAQERLQALDACAGPQMLADLGLQLGEELGVGGGDVHWVTLTRA